MARIFISYSRVDEDFARRLADSLKNIGVDIWLDVSEIPVGVNWSSSIQEALDMCSAMLLIISPDSMQSENVENEWQFYIDEKKPIIPIMYRPTRLHFQLSRLQYIDFDQHNFDTALVFLYKALINCDFNIDISLIDSDLFQDSEASSDKDGANLELGFILQGRYQIIGVLGGGGQGAVYLARDLAFDKVRRLVAIKAIVEITSDPLMKKTVATRLEREINLLATLDHRAIPALLDWFSFDRVTYIVMQYINGRDLESVLSRTKSLPLQKIIEWAIELCEVLHYLHNHKPDPIIFRDVKPANIMLDSSGNIRLIDFGFAKAARVGMKNTMIGTEGYSAPEQYRGEATPTSDMYSLGATLHHILTRTDPRLEPPFSFAERPIMSYNSDVSQDLAEAVMKALSFEPNQRYSNMLEFSVQLRQASSANKFVNNSVTSHGSENSTISEIAEINVSLRFKWTFLTEDEIRSTGLVIEEDVVFGSYDTNLWCLNKTTGEMRWKFETSGGIVSQPVYSNTEQAFLFGSEDGNFYSVDVTSGRLQWKFNTEHRIRSSATILNKYVFFGTDGGTFLALRTDTGKPVWKLETNSAIRSKPLVTEKWIIFGSEDGAVYALELDGSQKWLIKTGGAIHSKPILVDDTCYVGSFDGYVYAFDIQSGFVNWKYRVGKPIVSSLTDSDGNVFFAATNGIVYCVDSHSGKEKWVQNIGKPIVSSPHISDDHLIICSTDSHVYLLNKETGESVSKLKTGGSIIGTPTIDDKCIYIGTGDGIFYAIELVSQ